MENLCSPFLPHHCPSSPKMELVSSELGVGSHLGGFSWRENAGVCACFSAKNSGPVTTGMWLRSPRTFLFATRNFLEGRNSQGARGAATLSEGEEGESSASFLPMAPS